MKKPINSIGSALLLKERLESGRDLWYINISHKNGAKLTHSSIRRNALSFRGDTLFDLYYWFDNYWDFYAAKRKLEKNQKSA